MLAILNYHNVATAPVGMGLPRLYVTPDQFERQLWWLKRLGFIGVTLSEGMQRLRTGDSARFVALTFDDGYADNVKNAAPILKQYGFGATCFIVSGHIGSYNRWDSDLLGGQKPLMTEPEIRVWVDAGFEIGSHTCTHRDLTTLPGAEVMKEMVDSREALERLLGIPIAAFCYPYGRLNTETAWCAARSGYSVAVTTRRGRASLHDDLYTLPRLSVGGHKGMANFLLKAMTPYGDVDRMRRAQ